MSLRRNRQWEQQGLLKGFRTDKLHQLTVFFGFLAQIQRISFDTIAQFSAIKRRSPTESL
jgi:hypothetical protein